MNLGSLHPKSAVKEMLSGMEEDEEKQMSLCIKYFKTNQR
jgi:hypothetical protein